MKFKFEKLIIWERAMDFGEATNMLAFTLPKEEMFNLSSQIRRAVDSIALNISEGSVGQTNAEHKRFLSDSIRSVSEVVTCLYKARRRSYLTEPEFNNQYEYAFKNNIK
jgi:four helix bundle protein